MYVPSLDEEIAQLFSAGVDLVKVQGAIKVMHNAVLAHDENISVQTVAYAAAGMLAQALMTRNELSPSFRMKILAGFGDIAGSMLRSGIMAQMHEAAGHIVDKTVEVKEKPRPPAETHPLDEIFTTLVDPSWDLYALEEFQAMIEAKELTDEDGYIAGLAIKSEPDSYYYAPSLKAKASEFIRMDKRGATHIAWFTR